MRYLLLGLLLATGCSRVERNHFVADDEPLVFQDDSAKGVRCYGWWTRDAISCVQIRAVGQEGK